MITADAFAIGLSRLAVASRQPLDDATAEVYFEALSGQTNPPEWEEFTREAVRDGVFHFFPRVAELLDALKAWRDGKLRRNALPPHRLTPEDRAESFRRGEEIMRAEGRRRGVDMQPLIDMVIGRAPETSEGGGPVT